MSFWSFGVGIWSHSCLIQVSSCRRVRGHLWHFSINDAPNVLYRWRIWTAGSQFGTRTLLLWSHAVVIAVVCGFALSCWNTRHLEGSICCSKTFIYVSAFIVPSKTCKLPIPYGLVHPHTIRDSGFWTERWWQAGRSSCSLERRIWHPWFPTRMSHLDSSDHRTFFHFETVHFKWALAHRTQRRFWAMFGLFTNSGFWKYSWKFSNFSNTIIPQSFYALSHRLESLCPYLLLRDSASLRHPFYVTDPTSINLISC